MQGRHWCRLNTAQQQPGLPVAQMHGCYAVNIEALQLLNMHDQECKAANQLLMLDFGASSETAYK